MAVLLSSSLLTAPPTAAATAHETSSPTKGAVAGIPRYADARMAKRTARRVSAVTRIDIYRKRDASKRAQADHVDAQVLVSRPKSKVIRGGPITRTNLDGPDRATKGSRLRVVTSSGRVQAT